MGMNKQAIISVTDDKNQNQNNYYGPSVQHLSCQKNYFRETKMFGSTIILPQHDDKQLALILNFMPFK